jgi:opacity protein-like surface antigen
MRLDSKIISGLLPLILLSITYANMAAPLLPMKHQQGLYFTANLGHDWQDWQDFNYNTDITTGAEPSEWQYGQGGMSWGVDAGYHIDNFSSIEVGYYQLPKVSWSQPNSDTMNSWLGYAAAKFSMFVLDNPNSRLYSDAGIAYSASKLKSTEKQSNNTSMMFAVGWQYQIASHAAFNLQYMYIPGTDKKTSNHFRTPDISVITAGVSFNFAA